MSVYNLVLKTETERKGPKLKSKEYRNGNIH